jgi:hypothetical protein
MQVKAQVDSVSYSMASVHFEVSTITPAISDIKFPSSYYSVVVSDDLKKGDKIFDLSIDPAKAAQFIVYNISGINHYFSIHEYSGSLTLKRNLSELKLLKNSSKTFEFTVVTRFRESTTVAASTIIHVIVIPTYSGDTFDHLVETTTQQDSTMKKAKRSEFAFHRFFRQLSPIAQNISKAEMKFDKIIRGLRESVVDEFTGRKGTLCVRDFVTHSCLLNIFHKPIHIYSIYPNLFFVFRSTTTKCRSNHYKSLSNIPRIS